MPYRSINSLPDPVREKLPKHAQEIYSINSLPDPVREKLPKHAQEIYKEAFNNSHERYEDPGNRRDKDESQDEAAHRTAWAAVKEQYEQDDDGNGRRK